MFCRTLQSPAADNNCVDNEQKHGLWDWENPPLFISNFHWHTHTRLRWGQHDEMRTCGENIVNPKQKRFSVEGESLSWEQSVTCKHVTGTQDSSHGEKSCH